MAAGSSARAAGERRVAGTQFFVFVASWLWNQLASLVNTTPSGEIYPLIPRLATGHSISDTQDRSGISRESASERCHYSARSALMGSMDAARSAGNIPAMIATIASIAVMAASLTGSKAETP
jgi:hypothetical protein